MSEKLTPGEKEVGVSVDYKQAAESLARVCTMVAKQPFDEALVEVIQDMTNDQARTHFEALAASVEATAGNS